MTPSMKMGVIALIGICVVFYQYHLSTGVTFDQVTAFNADTSAEDAGELPIGEEGDNYEKTPRVSEDMVRHDASFYIDSHECDLTYNENLNVDKLVELITLPCENRKKNT